MTDVRQGESGSNIPQRSPRVFQKADGFWYFMTREKTEVGPFPSDEAATRGVNDYAGFGQDVDRIYESVAVPPVGDGLEELMGVTVEETTPPAPAERITDTEGAANVTQPRMFSSRIFSRESEWYFFTREGRDIGPFASREEAEAALVRYVEFASDIDRQIKSAYDETASQKAGNDERDDFLP